MRQLSEGLVLILLGTEGHAGQFMLRQHSADMDIWCESAETWVTPDICYEPAQMADTRYGGWSEQCAPQAPVFENLIFS